MAANGLGTVTAASQCWLAEQADVLLCLKAKNNKNREIDDP